MRVSFPVSCVSLFVFSVPALAECPEFRDGYTLCDFAQLAAQEIAPNLPQRISNNLEFSSILAIKNVISANITLQYERKYLDSFLDEIAVDRKDLDQVFVDTTRNFVCSDSELSSFVNAGGKVQYSYRFYDGYSYKNVSISSCN